MSYYPQYFTVIVHNTEQYCGFGSALPPEESHITPSLGITALEPHFTSSEASHTFVFQNKAKIMCKCATQQL